MIWPGEKSLVMVFAQGLTLRLPAMPSTLFLAVLPQSKTWYSTIWSFAISHHFRWKTTAEPVLSRAKSLYEYVSCELWNTEEEFLKLTVLSFLYDIRPISDICHWSWKVYVFCKSHKVFLSPTACLQISKQFHQLS